MGAGSADAIEPVTAAAREVLPDEHETEHAHPLRRQADIDDSGQWIPPSLRGMTKPDEREQLPKRRN